MAAARRTACLRCASCCCQCAVFLPPTNGDVPHCWSGLPGCQRGWYSRHTGCDRRGELSRRGDGDLFLEERQFLAARLPEKLVEAVGALIISTNAQKDRAALAAGRGLHDNDFAWFARYGLAVQHAMFLMRRRRAEPVVRRNIPRHAVLYMLAERRSGTLAAVKRLFDNHPYLQVGGNETVGMGWFAVGFRTRKAVWYEPTDARPAPAAHALGCIETHKKSGRTVTKIMSATPSTIATILMNGLGQAAATLLSKAEATSKATWTALRRRAGLALWRRHSAPYRNANGQ